MQKPSLAGYQHTQFSCASNYCGDLRAGWASSGTVSQAWEKRGTTPQGQPGSPGPRAHLWTSHSSCRPSQEQTREELEGKVGSSDENMKKQHSHVQQTWDRPIGPGHCKHHCLCLEKEKEVKVEPQKQTIREQQQQENTHRITNMMAGNNFREPWRLRVEKRGSLDIRGGSTSGARQGSGCCSGCCVAGRDWLVGPGLRGRLGPGAAMPGMLAGPGLSQQV